MKNLIKKIVLSVGGNLGSISNGIHILNGHYISRDDAPEKKFNKLLSDIKTKADFIKIEDAVKLIEQRLPLKEKLIAFTFDDGFEECYSKIAPILNQYNTNAAFFINPGFIDGDNAYRDFFCKNIVHVNKQPMTWDMVKKLHDNGFIIGNHTYNHAKLVNLSSDEINTQIKTSKQVIESHIGSKCDYFAWTYGKLSDIDKESLDLAIKEHKYVFSSDNYKKYYSLNNQVINRRHFEGDWSFTDLKYFLQKKSY